MNSVSCRAPRTPPAARLVPVFKESTTRSGERQLLRELGLGGGALDVIALLRGQGIFRGDASESYPLLRRQGRTASAVHLVGLGDEASFGAETLRRAIGTFARGLSSRSPPEVVVLLGAASMRRGLERLGWEEGAAGLAEGWLLGGYIYDCLKASKPRRRGVSLVLDPSGLSEAELNLARKGMRRGQIVAEAVNVARDLANAPPNHLYPEELALRARKVARGCGLECRVYGKSWLERQRMGCILGVGAGSVREPRFIVLRHRRRGRGVKRLAIVGKAVTFDSGGFSIKPAQGMEEMKFDMAGGAAVIGAMAALAKLRQPLDVIGIIPACEHLISGSALRPGDVLRSASGRTIEVINTDAEGRLLLADALHFARGLRPDVLVDIATLTGACVVALGNHCSGLVANDDGLARELADAGSACGDRVWRLPLLEEAFDAIKGQVADLKNSAGRSAAAITAAAFLAQFVGPGPWAHVDIAGTAWTRKDDGCFRAGATGVGVRLLVEYATRLAAVTR